MEIYNKLFHGINIGNYKKYIGSLESMDILKQILESGYIYTRSELYEKRKDLYPLLNSFHDQKINEVCLALHPNNTSYTEKLLFEASKYGKQSAFNGFVRKNISLILDEKLLNEKFHNLSGMYGEIRVQNSISLDYLDAIGYYDKIDYAINELKQILDNCDKISYKKIQFKPGICEIMYIPNINEYIHQEKQKYFEIKNLLEKYKFLVPVVDSYSGQPIEENVDLEIEKGLEIREKIKEMIRL